MNKVFLSSLPLDDALDRLGNALDTAGITRLPVERIAVADAVGRVTASPVFARFSSPFYHSAAMDGFAVSFADTLGASDTKPLRLRLGERAHRVNTGDPMPEECNAVIMVEDTNAIEDEIEIYAPATPYHNVRPVGEDIVATELIVPQQHRIRPVDMGALLASGHREIDVVRKPRMSVIPTGDELVDPRELGDRPPRAPEIIEYNSVLLAGLLQEAGAEAIRRPIVRDDREALKAALLEALAESDAVLLNAGSGRGTEDFTAAIIAELGELVIHSVSIKPGKPFIAGIVNGKPVFGIPGYPVSAFLTFRLFMPVLFERFCGSSPVRHETTPAIVSRQIASSLGVDEFVRVKVGEVGCRHIATPVGRGAGLLMSVVRADGLLRIPASSEGLSAGAEVEVELLRDRSELDSTIVCIGSHDNALDLLANAIKGRHPSISLSSAHVGSMGGLMALKRGEAHIAGTHLLDEETGAYNIPFVRKLLPDRPIALINLAYRTQGFVVKAGNPKRISGFDDLAREDVVFVNRQAGSGTRMLLDKNLREQGIDPTRIKGYDRDEYTHMAVASAVLTGLADTGLAVYSSAKALELDFIPVVEEQYDLAIPKEFLDSAIIKALLEIIRDDVTFRRAVEALGGYNTRDMGKVVFES